MLRLSEELRCTHNDDGAIVLDLHSGNMFHLNKVGSLILESIGKGFGEQEIVKEISGLYGIAISSASRDVAHFLESLEEQKLLIAR